MVNRCVVVIPVYAERPAENELLSFARCFRLLNAYPISVLAPQGLNLEQYRAVVPSFDVIYIASSWQQNITSYNKLKKSLFFYELFKAHEFVLTYELDAWVFKDELLAWCDKGWDYIGAPWFKGWAKGGSGEITGVGNSGFSLRNTQKSIACIKRIKKLKLIRSFWFWSRLQAVWRFNRMIIFFGFIFRLRSGKYLDDLLLRDIHNEDHFWGEYVSGTFDDYRVASIEDAIRFSFEVNPSLLYEMNQHQLPFGCHAWEKYEPDFWKPFINNTDEEKE